MGVSFAQAKQYCAWREAVLNVNRAVKLKVGMPDLSVYQLITDYTDSVFVLKKTNKPFCVFNFYHPGGLDAEGFAKSGGRALLRVDFFWPTKAGFYNIRGNAAEMTATEGVAFGGSFRHYASESVCTQQYARPGDWLGFRCMFKVKLYVLNQVM